MAEWLVVDWLKLMGHVPPGFPRYSVCSARRALAPEQEAAVVGRHEDWCDAAWAAAQLEAERLGLRFGAWGGGQAGDPGVACGAGVRVEGPLLAGCPGGAGPEGGAGGWRP